MIQIETHCVAPLATNCYFIIHTETKELAIVDPGMAPERILRHVQEEGWIPTVILLTHGHFDHIMGIRAWKKAYPDVKIIAGKAEEQVLLDTNLNMTSRFREKALSVEADVLLEDLDVIDIVGTRMQFLHTPGHTQGSGCFYLLDENTLFSGDTLFQMSMGRADLPTGDYQELKASLHKLSILPDDLRVLPGHGDPTVLGFEKTHNPYL